MSNDNNNNNNNLQGGGETNAEIPSDLNLNGDNNINPSA